LGEQNSISSESGIKYTSVVAGRGQISKVILPDSSVVWLNSGTTLTYDNGYSYKNRDLNLSGQAFLEVKKNKKLPLSVASGDLRIKVLGTRFDVCAYPDENSIRVFLESGKVELLNAADHSFNYKLSPGEVAKYNTQSGKIKIKEAAKGDYFTWKDGTLKFVDVPMDEVIKQLERKFDVEVTVKSPNVYKTVFNANFTTESLKEILDYIQFSCPISYQLIVQKETAKSKVILSNKNSPSH
jgi:ferric-dicitrate binding protein FerR (iron transport regulator)